MMGDVKEKLRIDVVTVRDYARDNMNDMRCDDYVAMMQVCAALLDALNNATPAPESLPTGDALADGWIADAMTLAQEFASSWSLVGGRFDDGTMLLSAEQRKSELRACLAAAALRSRQQVADGFERIAWQRVGADGTPLPIFVSRGEHLSPVCNYRDVFAAKEPHP